MTTPKKTGLFRQFLKRPRDIGAITPSSRQLALAMIHQVDWERARTVVEYGPGTGAITKHVLARVDDRHDFFAVEINEGLVATLSERFPDLQVYHDSATHIEAICETHGVEGIDAVISGLPWTVFPITLQQELVDSMIGMLQPTGVFVTFAYLHALRLKGARRFRAQLEDSFASVSVSRPVWLNLPPAIVYTCRR